MNWEDFPLMSTQPIGVQADGSVVELHPITMPGQLATISGGGGGMGTTFGTATSYDAGATIPAGWYIVTSFQTAQLIYPFSESSINVSFGAIVVSNGAVIVEFPGSASVTLIPIT